MSVFVRKLLLAAVTLMCAGTSRLQGEAMLQYFNTEWRELTAKMPELAEAGYTSLWLPPPTKGSGGLSVGYDLWDRFDLGSKDQRGTVRTRYGSEAELLELVETAHRFGLRVYFDNIMNHNAFDVPGFNADVPIDVYPGFVPEDFHLRLTEDGFYRKWDNTRNYNDAWQVQNLGLSDLIDIAHESPNTNHGLNEGDDIPKISFVRHPANPEYYLDTDLPLTATNSGGSYTVFTFGNKEPYLDTGYADGAAAAPKTTLAGGYIVYSGGGANMGAGNGRWDFRDLNNNTQHDAGEPCEPFQDTGVDAANPSRLTAVFGFGDNKFNMGNPVSEDVNGMLIRSARWILDRTKADGYRLDAVKHVPDYFFGQQSGGDKNRSSAGYLGQTQEQFNLSRGFSDWENHRDSVFDTEIGRDDAMVFGEHLGEPPGFGGYFDAGMRLVDNPLRNQLNDKLGNPGNGLSGYDQPGAGGFAPELGVTHAQSHDSDFAARRELQHAFYLTRAGLPLIYTDGNYHAGILGASGGAFPRHSNTAFLGQFADGRIPNLLYCHNQFGRGYQLGRWSDGDLIAYERVDKRENFSMSDGDGVAMLVLLNDNFSEGQRPFDRSGFRTSFPPGAYLWQYAGGAAGSGDSMTGFYVTVQDAGNGLGFLPGDVTVPRGGYYIFSWRSPEQTAALDGSEVRPVTILQGGQPLGTMSYERKDGSDGDANFNPAGVPNDTPGDYKYTATVPRVTNGANLSFVARADGSAENILLQLDGGVDLNSQLVPPLGPTSGDRRDYAPAVSNDTFAGYEQMRFVQRAKEKFAAADTGRNVIGSLGAETWRLIVGTAGFTSNAGGGTNSAGNTATYVYHDPAVPRDIGGAQFAPAPQSAGGQATTVKVKTGFQFQVNRVWLYYTTDGSAPEGSGGTPRGTTLSVSMAYETAGTPDGGNATDWWTGVIPAQTAGTVIRYKAGAFQNNAASVFPSNGASVDLKRRMESRFEITGFNAATATVRPHNDFSTARTGLAEGFHILRTRAFLNRAGRASIYNTWAQTFYYDTQTPAGEIRFPATNNETVNGNQYGVVVRTDTSVSEVWYHIDDVDAGNNDSATGAQSGNGGGPEPYIDGNRNGQRDANEPFTDINGNAAFDVNLTTAWVKATEATALSGAGALSREWRFDYRNIPASGPATLRVRLLELSSSRNFSVTAAQAHHTELTRTITCAGPDRRIFVAFPQQDREIVAEGYQMKVRFSAALADGTNEQQLRDRFSVRIASQTSDALAGAVGQPAQDLPIIYNAAAGFHDFVFALPALYNGNPEWIHTIEITHQRGVGFPVLVTTRKVRAQPAAAGVFVNIVTPPEIDSDGQRFEILLPAVINPTPALRSYVIEVETALEALGCAIEFTSGTGAAALVADGQANPAIEGTRKKWRFRWVNITAGAFTFRAKVDTDNNASTVEASATRNATVIFRELVSASGEPFSDINGNGQWDPGEPFSDLNGDGIWNPPYTDDADDDDDGLTDAGEASITALPTANSNSWTNAQVHIHFAYGFSLPLSPDSDGDGLPDGLEVGWRTAGNPPTNGLTNTNGDAFANFRSDLDPPFYNTLDNLGRVPGVNTEEEGGDRASLRGGTATGPGNPDSDGDGLLDGVEDTNRNGWVDGDGQSLASTTAPSLARAWPNNRMDPGETWIETSPTQADSDRDELSDGFGEDRDGNGRIAGDADNDRTYDTGESWGETNPLKADTDGDGLPDGWEARYNLDPLDGGTDSMRTGVAGDGLLANGAAGDPDADGFNNAQELANGTDPKSADTGITPPAGSIVIGPQPPTVVGGISHAREFTDWTADDLLVLDEREGDGQNNQGGDVYQAGDGFDSSRDLVAFYARDGGDTSAGGDGNFYFRADLQDLLPFAEDGGLDLYVVIDTGNAASGEYALPDDTDVGTEMRWEAVVAVYSGNNGRVYVDTNNGNNSTAIGQNLTGFGVQARDQNTANGFKKAYFNSELDAMEFSISRQALRDAGWNGLNPAQLRYQVFTTKDGTGNNPPGAGDIGGRLDVRDTIYDDFLAEDHAGGQSGISGDKGVLRSFFSGSGANDRGRRAKLVMLVHGNQAIQPGSTVQALMNNAQGAGYYRALDAHQAYSVPLALHVTPTLASAIQWAAADPASPRQYRDGPAFNNRLKMLAQGGTVDLLGSTFSDHALPYFTQSFHSSNVNLAHRFLDSFYGAKHSRKVLWLPERVANGSTFGQVAALGFSHTFVDQGRHLLRWFGRTSALSNDGYRINEINGLRTFVINDQASSYRFQNSDRGLPFALRDLLLRKARSGQQDQVVTLLSQWEDFTGKPAADAYDRNLRWIAAHPWIQVVTPDEIAAGTVDLSIPPDGMGDTWGTVNRGTNTSLPTVAHDYLDHATQENYDNWYNGQASREEGLRNKRFDIRPGVQLATGKEWGSLPDGTGLIAQAWTQLGQILQTPLLTLARGTAHAAVFESAFHNQSNNDLSKFSTGAYINPDTSYQELAPFAKAAQAQFRHAAVYRRVDQWATQAAGGSLLNSTVADGTDIDLDGLNEYILYNDRVFAAFERHGGRMVGAWVRDIQNGTVFQAVGNPLAYAATDTEFEGATNILNGGVNAHRVSGFRDQFAQTGGAGQGTSLYVNDQYSVNSMAGGGGFRFTSADGKIVKDVTLAPRATTIRASYVLTGGIQRLFIRFGLSPNLEDLLLQGQANLTPMDDAAHGEWNLFSQNGSANVRAFIRYGAGNGSTLNTAAADRDSGVTFDTINMRNLAQTHQVEVSGAGSFSIELGLQTGSTITLDSDGDGLPDWWENTFGLDPLSGAEANGAGGNTDLDDKTNLQEFILQTNPLVQNFGTVPITISTAGNGRRTLQFPTLRDRNYRILYTNNLVQPWEPVAPAIIGTGTEVLWTDDGTQTGGLPGERRFYRVEILLPAP